MKCEASVFESKITAENALPYRSHKPNSFILIYGQQCSSNFLNWGQTEMTNYKPTLGLKKNTY